MPTTSHIAFICSGNICRSPMAEALAREMLQRLGISAEISSAGTLGIDGHPAAENAVRVLSMMAIELTTHRSQGITREYLEAASAVVVMEEEHAKTATLLDPTSASRIHRLWEHTKEPERLDEIHDPIGRGLDDFIECRDDLVECLQKWLPNLIAGS